ERVATRSAPRPGAPAPWAPTPAREERDPPALSASCGEAARLSEDALSTRRAAASETTSVAAGSRTAAALIAVAVPLALGALTRLVVVAVLVHGPDRQVHPTHAVDFGDLDLDLVADFDGIFDGVH